MIAYSIGIGAAGLGCGIKGGGGEGGWGGVLMRTAVCMCEHRLMSCKEKRGLKPRALITALHAFMVIKQAFILPSPLLLIW